jgi:cephalosporin-C deacetylase-like acetyl esterase
MYSYITRELPEAVFAGFEQIDSERVSIMGHSMGGHGALALVCTVQLYFFSFLSGILEGFCEFDVIERVLRKRYWEDIAEKFKKEKKKDE